MVGSITHCDGYRAAAVARTSDIATVGLDAEPDKPLPSGVLEMVSLPAERAQIADLSARRPEAACWDRLLFCAKESVYKTWFPVSQQWLGFDEAEVVIDADAGTFTARLLVPGPIVAGLALVSMHGRWLAHRGLVVAAIAVPGKPGPIGQ